MKENLETRLESWQKETDHLTSVFRELGKCKRKDLLKQNAKLASEVATVEKEMLKRVNPVITHNSEFLTLLQLMIVKIKIKLARLKII